MTKPLNVTVSDWVFNKIEESKPKGISRSEYVEELLIKSLSRGGERVIQ